MANTVARALKQQKPFSSAEQEVVLGLLIAAARVMEPWAKFLKTTAQLTTNQYNVLRILRGSHPGMLACSDIAERMIERDPDITRLIDRLEARGLDPHVQEMPKALLGHLGAGKLGRLRNLLEAVISTLGTFP